MRSAAALANGPCFVKVLVISGVAGSIIGKNGSEIANIFKSTECTVKLSNPSNFFPNTLYRICILSGTLTSIENALVIILNKIKEFVAAHGLDSLYLKDRLNTSLPKSESSEERIACTIAVPKTAVSSIIGKGGQCIKSLMDSSGCKIVVSDRDNGLYERLVNFFGSYEAVKSALFTVLQVIQEDTNLKECCLKLEYKEMSVPSTLSLPAHATPHSPSYLAGYIGSENVAYPGVQSFVLQSHCEIFVHIPDSAMGAVIGKQGSCMSEIMRKSGARIVISQKGEFVEGTSDRPITLSGTVLSVHHAHAMLLQQYLSATGAHDVPAIPPNGPVTAMRRGEYVHSPFPALNNGGAGPVILDTFPSGHALRHTRSRPPLVSPYALNP